MKQLNSENDFLLTSSDLINVIKKSRHAIVKMAMICAFIAFCYGLSRPIEYKVEATFKEKGKSQSGLNQSLSALLLNAEAHENEALTLMRSRMLIEKLVKLQGLQAELIKNEVSFPKFFKRIKDNLLSEYANIKKLTHPILIPLDEDIKAEKVDYDGEVPLELSLEIKSDEDFNLITPDGVILGQGRFDSPFFSEQFSFTLQKKSPDITSGQYRLILHPLGKTAQAIAKKFSIESDRFDSSLLKLAYRHPDKYQAAAHTNALMDLYKEHSHQEHQYICNLQIAYLQEKQADMSKQLEELMSSHAYHLSSDLSNTGFADYTSAMNFLTSNQHNYKQRLQAIDLEIYWLKQAQKEDREKFDKFTSTLNPDFINQLIKDIRQLKHEADSLKLALRKFEPAARETLTKNFLGIDLNTAKELYLAYSKELNTLEAQEAQFNFLINQINLPDFEISSLSTVLTDPISTEMISKASPLVLALKDQDNRTQKEQERLKSGLSVHKEFFITHLGQTSQLTQLRQQLMKEKIEALQNAHLALISEQISIHENQMADYIAKRLIALEHEKNLYEQQLVELRSEMAALPSKWVAEQMIEQNMEINRNMIEQISKLVESKNLASNLEKTQSTSVDLPIVPIHPQPPHLLLLTLIGALTGGFLGTGWAIVKSIGKGVTASLDNLRLAGQHVSGALSLHNYSLSLEGLKESSSQLLDSDLETLRRMILFITTSSSCYDNLHKENALLLLYNRGPRYAKILAQLMSKMGFKILILDLCFSDQENASTNQGVLQYLQEDSVVLNIEHKVYYDVIYAGGITRFANEMFASDKFKKLILELKSKYDWMIAINGSSPLSAEAETLLKQFDKAIITINDESLQDLRQGALQYSILKSFIINPISCD